MSAAVGDATIHAAGTSPAASSRAKNLALALLVVTQFVIVIDGSIVNVALPSIGRHLHFSQTGGL
jgi:hypothetical protein